MVSVIRPDQVLDPAMLRRAPPALMPVPRSAVTGSATVRLPAVPSISIAAPVATEVAPAVVPSDVAFWTRTTPALMVVTPV